MVLPKLFSGTEHHHFWHFARLKHARDKRRKRRSGENGRLPHLIRFGYALGHVLNDLCASMWFTYALVFYTAVIEVSHKWSGIIIIIGQIADALSTPLIGYLSDHKGSTKSGSKSFGRRKGWYVVGTILICCTMPFMFSPCWPCRQSADIVKVAYFSGFIIVFQFGWAAVQTIHLAMAADLTPFDSERTFLLSLRNMMTALCNAVTYCGQWASIAMNGDEDKQVGNTDVVSFQIVGVVIVIVGFCTSVGFLSIVPEDGTKFRTVSSESSSGGIEAPAASVQSIGEVLSKWRLHHIGFIYMNCRIFVVSVQALLTLYLHESLQAHSYELATVPLVLNVACFGASYTTGLLGLWLGRKSVFTIGTVCGLGACVSTYFGSGQLYSHHLIYIVAIFFGIAGAWLQVTALSLVAIYIGNEIHSGAFIYGYMSFLDKISTGVLLALILGFHQPKFEEYFTYAVILCCSISSILATWALWTLPFRIVTPTDSKLTIAVNTVKLPPKSN